jgi:hypothetical protein
VFGPSAVFTEQYIQSEEQSAKPGEPEEIDRCICHWPESIKKVKRAG